MSDTEAATPSEQPEASTVEQTTEETQPAAPEQVVDQQTETPSDQPKEEGESETVPSEDIKPAAESGEQQADETAPTAVEGGEATEESEKKEDGERKGEGEGEGEGDKEEGDKGEGDEGKEEEEVQEEEPIVITTEGSRYWLSTEDVLAKGVPEDEVENFKNYYYKEAQSLHAWYDKLKDFTQQTEYITLSKDEIEALTIEGDPNEEQQQVLTGLEERLNGAIELYGEEGAFVRVGERSAKDGIMECNEESFIAEVRDNVNNQLEVEKQSANAYAIWKEEKHPGAFRRGLTKIRQSFRRSRATGAVKKEGTPKLEDDKKEGEDEAPKADEAAEGDAEAKPEGDAEPKEEGATGGAEVTVEAEIEETDKDKAEEKPSEDKPAEEPQAEEPKADEEPKAEDQVQQEVEEPKAADAEEKKEGDDKPTEGEEKKEEDGEIQKVEDGGEETKEEEEGEKKERSETSPKRKKSQHHHHHHPKSKHDNIDNQLMRAFITSISSYFRVANGKEAVEKIRKSGQIKRDLNQLKPFCGIEGVQFSMSMAKWDTHFSQYPGMELRGFVYGNELRALSQYNDQAYFPNVDYYKGTIQSKVETFFKEKIQEPLNELENYIIDFFVSPEKIYVLRLNPFFTNVGACLFTWAEHAKILTRGPFEFRIVTASKTSPDAYSSLQSFWSEMLQDILQQKKGGQRTRGGGCVIL